MARILFLAPMPPAATGIAPYASAVLRRIKRSRMLHGHHVETLWPVGKGADRKVWEADLPVYHIGNNLDFHREIYVLAIRHPGLVVLHDLALDDLVAGLDAVDDPLGPRTRLEAMQARHRLRGSALALDEPLQTPWCALVARRARGIVVHSDFGRRYLEAMGCQTPAFVAPHVPLVEPGGLRRWLAERRVAERLGERPEGELLVGVLGDVGGAKGIDAVLRAARLSDDPMRVAIVGRRIPGYDVTAAAAAARLEDRVVVAHDVSDHAFWAWLRACDVVVNLRHPHRGEVSGTMVRALQAGTPAVVSATGTYLDLPEDAVVRIPGGPPDPVEIAHVLRRLARDPEERRRIGERARAHVEDLAQREATARAYADAIESTLRLVKDPTRAALGRWAEALSGMGADGRDVRAGLGSRYVQALDELTRD